MYVRVLFVKMHHESDNVILTEFLCDKIIHINRPFFYILLTLDASVVSSFLEIDLLISEGKFTHPLAVATQHEIRDGNAVRFETLLLLDFVRVFDIPTPQVIFETLVYGIMFAVNGADYLVLTINPDGTLTPDRMWGFYAMDETFENEVGWFDVAKASEFAPVEAGARRSAAISKSLKTVKAVASSSARSLKKRVRK